MGKRQTVSYWYGASLHMALCHGPVDALTEIIIGDKTAWTGNVTANGSVVVFAPDLFGGEEREGGPNGVLEVMMGGATQAPNAYLQGKFGANIPAFRGVVTVLYRGRLQAGNPYLKPWRFRVRRIPAAWYPAKASIGSGDANPAHIIRECLTDTTWGLGWPAADIDDASFTAAADTLHGESFGLSILWERDIAIEEFIASVLRHIDGILFIHPRTAQFTLRLVRGGYSVPSLPLYGPANVLAVREIVRPAPADLANQIVLTYRDGASGRPASITVQNLALIAAAGGVVSASVEYDGIANATLAARVAQRELAQHGAALLRVSLIADRSASSLLPGDVFRFTWPEAGITETVLRAVRVGYGAPRDGGVHIDAVQDVFSLPQAAYAPLPSSGWTSPVSNPAPCPAQALIEVPYWLIVQDVVGEIPSILGDISADEGMVAALGLRPSADAIDYQCVVWDAAAAAWVDRGRGQFAWTALLASALPQAASDATVAVTSTVDWSAIGIGDLVLIDDEMLVVVAYDAGAATVTLARGALDTVPAPHAAGARAWGLRHLYYVQPEYLANETAQARLLPKTGRGQLATSGATTVSRTIQRRFIRPYPPGRVQVNGQYFPATASGDLTITWARRNRVQQTAPQAPRFTDADVTPEAGSTVTLRVYNAQTGGALIRTVTGLTGTSYTYTEATAAADNGGTKPANVRLEISCERSGYESLYRQVAAFGWT